MPGTSEVRKQSMGAGILKRLQGMVIEDADLCGSLDAQALSIVRTFIFPGILQAL